MGSTVKLANDLYLETSSIVHKQGDTITPLDDKIIYDSGSNSNGEYIRFADGTMICSKYYAGNPTSVLQWSSAIYYVDVPMGSWAAPFKVIKNVQVSNATNQYWCNIVNASETSAGTVRLIRPDKNAPTYNIHLFAIGRWK